MATKAGQEQRSGSPLPSADIRSILRGKSNCDHDKGCSRPPAGTAQMTPRPEATHFGGTKGPKTKP